MQPTRHSNRDNASRAACFPNRLVRIGALVAVALASVLVTTAGAESLAEPQSTPAEQTSDGDAQAAEASNGGVGSASTSGNIEIDEIVTGENSGDVIVAGDVVGTANISGGESAYSAELGVSLITGPQVVDASGGDGGEAAVSADDSTDDNGKDNGANTDITVINRNDNRSNAKVIDKTSN